MKEIIKNKKKSEILAEEIAKMSYGDVIFHSNISSIINEIYNTQRYISTIQKTKKILLKEYGIVLESIRGDGYRIVQPDDYVTHSLKHYKKGFNEFQKGADTLSHAPVNQMSDEGRNTYRRVNDRAVILHASLKGAVVELKTLGEKKHPFLPKNIKDNNN